MNTHDDGPEDSEAAAAAHALRALQEEFPQFRIWREITRGRTRYIARSLQPGTGPHTLVTPDPDELRAELPAYPDQPHLVSLSGHDSDEQ